METKNIFQKIQSVANEIKNIEKKLVVGEGKNAYNAVGDQKQNPNMVS